jgi:hypothetical protein
MNVARANVDDSDARTAIPLLTDFGTDSSMPPPDFSVPIRPGLHRAGWRKPVAL